MLFASELALLGHVVSGAGISTDPCETDWIADWPQPMTATNVRGFLGLTCYIATFLPALTEYTSILSPLTTKECDILFPPWTGEHQKAFDMIKSLVLGVDCLTMINYYDLNKKICVTTNVSN
jgi:hypothetical protein